MLNYFHLICAPMQKTGLLPQEFYDRNFGSSEPLVQTSIVRYQTPEGFQDKRTLDISRILSIVKRFYKGGDFVIFSKASMFYDLWKQNPGCTSAWVLKSSRPLFKSWQRSKL